ncbi:MAG: hypothetical protein A2Y73_04730, partial [Chloroflexi bacterium RBG_13_56_8]
MSPFEELGHPADLCLRIWGQDLGQLFADAARGMFHLMRCSRSEKGRPVSHRVVLDSYDLEALLVDWLNELLYLSEADEELYHSYSIVHLEPGHLEAVVQGKTECPCERGIKATTFSGLEVIRTEIGYEATI